MVAAQEFVDRLQRSRGAWAPELRGKVAIVTGAGRLRSIGRPIALELARQGVNVVLTGTGRDPKRYPPDEQEVGWRDIESVADEVRGCGAEAVTLVSDVSRPEDVDTMVQTALYRFGRIDILVNNAGAARGPDRVPVLELPFEEWLKVINVNLNGSFLAAKEVAQAMVDQGEGGSIINVSSIASKIAGASTAAYSSSKAGLNALSRAMALELAPQRIRVNAVCPSTPHGWTISAAKSAGSRWSRP